MKRLIFIIGILLFILPALLSLSAQEPKHNPPIGGNCIYLSTGEFYQEVTDLTIPGRGFSFRFTRNYRAQGWYDGPLGFGWDFSYNARIEKIGDDINYYNGAGRIDKYSFAGTQGDVTSFTSPDGFYNIVEYYPVTNTYALFERDGTKYTFGANPLISNIYQLTTISDRNGNQMSFTYGDNPYAAGTQYVLLSVTDTMNRIVTFAYTAQNRIDYIEDWLSPVHRRVDFTYNANGDLTYVRSPVTTEYPNGKTTGYTYTSGQLDIRMNHKMLTVRDPKGQTYLTNFYDERGRVIQQNYGFGTFYNEYYEATETEPAMVRVTDRNGNVSDSWLTPQGNVSMERRYTKGLRPDEPDYFETNYEHIQSTERSKTIFPKGNSVEYLYDIGSIEPRAKGNLLQVKRVSGANELVNSFTHELMFNQVKTTTDAMGRVTTFYFDYEEAILGDLNGDLITDQDNGNVVKIVYPTVTLPDATQQIIESKFRYNQFGQITESIDPENIVTLYEYYPIGHQSYGYLQRVTRNSGGTPSASTEYEYDSVGNITGITDARGHKTAFQVNQLNQVTKSISRPPFNYEVKFSYDANDNLKRTEVQNIDENGILDPALPWIPTDYAYDILDNMNSKKETVSPSTPIVETKYIHDRNENLYLFVEPENNMVWIVFDERDLAWKTTRGFCSPASTRTFQYYDPNGNLTKTTIGDESKGTVTYEYDGFDRRKKTTDALGNYALTDYDDNSNVIKVRRYSAPPEELLLSDVSYDYDELNRMYKITAKKFDTPGGTGNPVDVITTFWYDKKGRRWKTERTRDAQTLTTTIDFDNLDRIESVTDPVGNKVEYTSYDANGNPLTIKETEKKTGGDEEFYTYNEYDNLDRLISTTNWTGTTEFKYDSRNNNKYTKDRENHETMREYDLMNRLTENIYVLATGDIHVKYGLDKNGRLVTLTDDNNNVTEYEYDEANRRKLERLPDDTTKQYTFDQYGALYQMTDNNGSVIQHTYDNALRLIQKDITRSVTQGVLGTTQEVFAYDGAGRMTSAQNNDSTIAMTYDSFGNLLTETQNGKTVTSAYDVLSFRESLSYPSGNKTMYFDSDDLNRIYRIKSADDDYPQNRIAQYTYAGPGRVTERTYLNGTSLGITYDDGRRAITYTHGATIGGFGYSFDKMNNKLYENRTFEGKGDAFKYDEIYRLTGVKYGVTNLSPGTDYSTYAYEREENYLLDGVGNREDVETTLWGQQTTTATYTANALNQYDTISDTEITDIDYDANGNLISDTAKTYVYDYANRLLKVTRQSDSRILGEYKYDVLGRRIWKSAWSDDTQSSTETNYYYDGARCIEEQTTGGTTIATYVFGNGIDEVLTMERDSQTYYYHENSLGSIYAVTTGTGTVAERYAYDAYGNVTFLDASGNQIVSSTIGNRILFTGREFDSETGLYYYRARYYSAEQGRFINRDPLSDDELQNLYAYVSNSPYNATDPLGLYEKDTHQYRTTEWGIDVGLDPKIAVEIGYWNNQVDVETPAFEIAPDGSKIWIKENMELHFMERAESERLMQEAIDRCDVKAFAQAMHSFQDYNPHMVRAMESGLVHGMKSGLYRIGNWMGVPIARNPDEYQESDPLDKETKERSKYWLGKLKARLDEKEKRLQNALAEELRRFAPPDYTISMRNQTFSVKVPRKVRAVITPTSIHSEVMDWVQSNDFRGTGTPKSADK